MVLRIGMRRVLPMLEVSLVLLDMDSILIRPR